MVTLYDHRGNKIKRSALKHEQSEASMQSVRRPHSLYPSVGITPQYMASILRQADQGNPRAQCELFEELEEKDAHIMSLMNTRKRAVAMQAIVVEAPEGADASEQRAADLVREQLAAIPNMSDVIMGMMDAVGKGYAASEIIWQVEQQQAMVAAIKWREPKWFRFDNDTLSELRLIDGSYVDGKSLTPYKYIVHTHRAKAGLPVRGGVLRPCAWMYMFKNFALKDWAIFNEVYGQPLRVGKYAKNASESEKDILLNAVANMGSDAAAVIPEGMMIEFIEAGGKTGSVNIYEKMARYTDEQNSKAILGQTSSADAMSGGIGTGQSDLHGEVRHDLIKADARAISETLTRDLAVPIVALNIGHVGRMPRIVVKVHEAEDLTKLASNVQTLHGLGLPIATPWLYQKFNIPVPAKGEDVIAASMAGQLAANSTQPATPDAQTLYPVDILTEQGAQQADKVMGEWLAQIEIMLDQAEDLPQFREMLLAAFGDLSAAKLASIVKDALMSAELAGRFDIAGEDS